MFTQPLRTVILFLLTIVYVIALIVPATALYAQAPPGECWVCDPREYAPERKGGPPLAVGKSACTAKIRQYCAQGLLPFCARTRLGCNEVGDVLLTAVKYGRFIFGIAGALALLFIVYGGGLMMFSFGSSERMQQGKSALTAAVIGLVIIFSAYLVVAFLIKTVDVATVQEQELGGAVKQVLPL